MPEPPTVADVLLDLDGTLTDNFVGISRSIEHALRALDAPVPESATLRSCVGPPLRASFRRLLATEDPERIEQAIALYRERYSVHGWQENTPYEDIGAMLDQLVAAGRRLWVCTSKPAVFARRIVEHFGFSGRIRAVYGPELGGVHDDKVSLLRHLLQREAIAPSRCAMIGDRHHDIDAARENGALALGVLWGYGSREELEAAGARAVFSTPAQIGPWLAGHDASAA